MASTLLAIPFVPVFFVVLERMSARAKRGKGSPPAAPPGEPGPPSPPEVARG
jgi:hypothetical protein